VLSSAVRLGGPADLVPMVACGASARGGRLQVAAREGWRWRSDVPAINVAEVVWRAPSDSSAQMHISAGADAVQWAAEAG
jgi:hypothetical protein